MRGHLGFAAVMGLAMASVGIASPAVTERAVVTLDETRPVRTPQKKRKAVHVAGGSKPIRSRGAAAPKRKRSNRLHVSRRVRRKHRRAA